MDFNFADVGVVIILIVSVIIGIYRGFLRELLTVTTWAIAALLAYVYGKDAGQIFGFTDSAVTKEILGMIMIFAAVVMLGFLIKYLVCKWFNISGASTLDRIIGALFGLMRGALIISLLLLIPANYSGEKWFKDSASLSFFAKGTAALQDITPSDWKKHWEHEKQRFTRTNGAVSDAQDSAAVQNPNL